MKVLFKQFGCDAEGCTNPLEVIAVCADDSFDALFHFGGVNLYNEPEKAINEFVRVVRKNGIVSWGDEAPAEKIPGGWKKKFLIKMNPGYLKKQPAIPDNLESVKEYEVYGGYGYLVVGIKK